MEAEVDHVPRPCVEPGPCVVEGETGQQHGPEHRLVGITGELRWIRQEAKRLTQTLQMRIPGDRVQVVVVPGVSEDVGKGRRYGDGEEERRAEPAHESLALP